MQRIVFLGADGWTTVARLISDDVARLGNAQVGENNECVAETEDAAWFSRGPSREI